jgi:hypothetical protein
MLSYGKSKRGMDRATQQDRTHIENRRLHIHVCERIATGFCFACYILVFGCVVSPRGALARQHLDDSSTPYNKRHIRRDAIAIQRLLPLHSQLGSRECEGAAIFSLHFRLWARWPLGPEAG